MKGAPRRMPQPGQFGTPNSAETSASALRQIQQMRRPIGPQGGATAQNPIGASMQSRQQAAQQALQRLGPAISQQMIDPRQQMQPMQSQQIPVFRPMMPSRFGGQRMQPMQSQQTVDPRMLAIALGGFRGRR